VALHLDQFREGFGPGCTWITRFDEADDNTGIALAVHKLGDGERFATKAATETAWLLMDGEVTVEVGGSTYAMNRSSLFDESESCIHVAAGEDVSFACRGNVEFTVYESANRRPFASRVFTPENVPNEHRGAGQVGGACTRFVRTIFDDTNSDPNTELVLGEVVTMPGRWSSYPPHHHPQPEIYHYRFTHPQGYGHAELGEAVHKVRQFDSIKIFFPADHTQCASPGYGMYYSWVIRHLSDDRYSIPEFTAEHRWVTEAGASMWRPAELDDDG
jgi:5-deoxy-glucuronate isomerase